METFEAVHPIPFYIADSQGNIARKRPPPKVIEFVEPGKQRKKTKAEPPVCCVI